MAQRPPANSPAAVPRLKRNEQVAVRQALEAAGKRASVAGVVAKLRDQGILCTREQVAAIKQSMYGAPAVDAASSRPTRALIAQDTYAKRKVVQSSARPARTTKKKSAKAAASPTLAKQTSAGRSSVGAKLKKKARTIKNSLRVPHA